MYFDYIYSSSIFLSIYCYYYYYYYYYFTIFVAVVVVVVVVVVEVVVVEKTIKSNHKKTKCLIMQYL